jgi:hypothetical protein
VFEALHKGNDNTGREGELKIGVLVSLLSSIPASSWPVLDMSPLLKYQTRKYSAQLRGTVAKRLHNSVFIHIWKFVLLLHSIGHYHFTSLN